MKKQFIYQALLSGMILLVSCQKQKDWLDVRVNLNSVVPSRLTDYQALLDADYMFQGQGFLSMFSNGQVSLPDADVNAMSVGVIRNAYLWAKNIYEGPFFSDWEAQYKIVAVANICLEGLSKITASNSNVQLYDQVKGTAHYYRALGFYQLLQLYAPAYVAATASSDLGIPLRFESDVNLIYGRSSVADCYAQVVKDLEIAIQYLPEQSSVQTRPNKASAQGILARVMLVLGKWNEAAQYAGTVLQKHSTLLDFNGLSATSSLPFPTIQNKHPEVLHYQQMDFSSTYAGNNSLFDTVLYQSYANNDLRKSIFFRLVAGKPVFKGFYTGINGVPFGGLATNEVYLIRAEAMARLGNVSEAMNALNSLLQKRWRTGSFLPLTAVDPADALRKVITERRKELPFSGNLVWTDLRRFNLEPPFARSLKRVYQNSVYELSPNSIRYVLPIPDAEIRFTGITQNPR